MSSSLITKLKKLIEEGGSEEDVEALEDAVAYEIEKFVKEECFYELPTNEILKIVEKSNIADVESHCELVSRMSASKGRESALLQNVIGRKGLTIEECIKIFFRIQAFSTLPKNK